MTAPVWHFSSTVTFQAACGADTPNMVTTEVPAHVTCPDCKRRLEPTTSPKLLTEKELAEIEDEIMRNARYSPARPTARDQLRRLIADLRAARAAIKNLLDTWETDAVGIRIDRALEKARGVLPKEPPAKRKCEVCGTDCGADEEGAGCNCPTWCFDIGSGVQGHARAALPRGDDRRPPGRAETHGAESQGGSRAGHVCEGRVEDGAER